MRLVVIESPYSGDTARNLEYLDRCIRDCLQRDESPYASHKMLTTALDDDKPQQRVLGIQAGIEFARAVDKRVFYIDLGWSQGMLAAREHYDKLGFSYEVRRLEPAPFGDD